VAQVTLTHKNLDKPIKFTSFKIDSSFADKAKGTGFEAWAVLEQQVEASAPPPSCPLVHVVPRLGALASGAVAAASPAGPIACRCPLLSATSKDPPSGTHPTEVAALHTMRMEIDLMTHTWA